MRNESNSDTPAANAQAQPAHQAPATPSTPSEGTLADNGKGNAETTRNEADELAREFRAAEKWVIGTNITLAIIGIFALCIYHGQLEVMRGQLGEIVRQYPLLEKSAAAAKQSADTADASFKAAAENFRTAQRAWVGVRSMSPLVPNEFIRPGGPFSIMANISNVGQTPAIHIRSTIGQDPAVCPDRFNPAKEHFRPEESNGFLMPNSPGFTGPNSILITQTAYDKLMSRECGYYIFGRIIYCDIFSISHYRNFCWKWRVGTPYEFDACEKYNDGDEDYPDTPPKKCSY